MGIFYRHPRPDYKLFSKEYERLLIQLANEKANYQLVGDYNIDFLKSSKNKSVENYMIWCIVVGL